MAWLVGDAVQHDGRTGVVDAIETDGTLHVWFGNVRSVDQARICETLPADSPLDGNVALRFAMDKQARMTAIDARTDALIDQGFRFPPGQGPVFSLASGSQQQLIGAYAGRLSPFFTYPLHWGAKDGSSIPLGTADELEMFYLVAVGTVRAHLDSGQVLKERVAVAQTPVDLAAVVDER